MSFISTSLSARETAQTGWPESCVGVAWGRRYRGLRSQPYRVCRNLQFPRNCLKSMSVPSARCWITEPNIAFTVASASSVVTKPATCLLSRTDGARSPGCVLGQADAQAIAEYPDRPQREYRQMRGHEPASVLTRAKANIQGIFGIRPSPEMLQDTPGEPATTVYPAGQDTRSQSFNASQSMRCEFQWSGAIGHIFRIVVGHRTVRAGVGGIHR